MSGEFAVRTIQGAEGAIEKFKAKLEEHRAYIREQGNDPPGDHASGRGRATAAGRPDGRWRAASTSPRWSRQRQVGRRARAMEMLSHASSGSGFFRPIVASGRARSADRADPPALPARTSYDECMRSRTPRGRPRSRGLRGGRKRVVEAYRALERELRRRRVRGHRLRGAAPALDFELNADLANELGCPVLPVVRRHDGGGGHVGRGSPGVARAEGLRDLRGDRQPGRRSSVAEATARAGEARTARSPVYVVPERPELASDRCRGGGEARSAALRLGAEVLQRESGT